MYNDDVDSDSPDRDRDQLRDVTLERRLAAVERLMQELGFVKDADGEWNTPESVRRPRVLSGSRTVRRSALMRLRR